MTKNILLISIRPEYADKILKGEKTVELRRVRTRLTEGDMVLVYVSSPVKALVCSFEVEYIIEKKLHLPEDLKDFWKDVQKRAGINQREFKNYYKDASLGVGIFFDTINEFPKRVKLEYLRKKLPNVKPPQSYRYIKDDEFKILEKSFKN